MKRRDFIRNSALGAILPAVWGRNTFWSMGQMSSPLMVNDNVLVVVQMAGGNDGLNTVIPVNQYSNYLKARENIAISESKLLSVSQSMDIGLHPSMMGIANLMNQGQASIVHDVGYPNPNFSHFRATDIWNTGSDSSEYLESGWAGRFLGIEHLNYPEGYPNEKYPDPLAIQIGTVVNTALQGTFFNMGVAVNQVSGFYELQEDSTTPVTSTLAGKELSFLREVTKQSNKYADTIQTAAERVTQQKEYPDTKLADQLKIVARLIAGGMKTKIYFVKIGGFDTHSDQVESSDTSTGNHAELLKELSEAISAFQDDLKFLNIADKVMGMTYSEFGRRIKSNGSAGTDHGAAAPMFLFGTKVNPTLFGTPTPLPTAAANDDNIVMQYDFRSVYASILKHWFCVQDNEIEEVLLKNFQSLQVVQADVCGSLLGTNNDEQLKNLTVSPNIVRDHAVVNFTATDGHHKIQLFNTRGQEVDILFDKILTAGPQQFPIDLSAKAAGTYFVRLQSKNKSEVFRVVKM